MLEPNEAWNEENPIWQGEAKHGIPEASILQMNPLRQSGFACLAEQCIGESQFALPLVEEAIHIANWPRANMSLHSCMGSGRVSGGLWSAWEGYGGLTLPNQLDCTFWDPPLSWLWRQTQSKGSFREFTWRGIHVAKNWLTTCPTMLGLLRSFCLWHPPKPEVRYVDQDWLASLKSQDASLSTNDILTSHLLTKSRFGYGYMSINLRNRGLGADDANAGNYVHRVHLAPGDFAEPDGVRKSISEPFRFRGLANLESRIDALSFRFPFFWPHFFGDTVDGRNPAPLSNHGRPLLFVFRGESALQGFLGGAGFRPSTVSPCVSRFEQ